MAIIATDRADFWGFNPGNFLLSYCNANSLATSGYYVEAKEDGSTGLIFYNIHPNSDGAAGASDTDPSTPQVVDISTNDSEVAAEDAVSS